MKHFGILAIAALLSACTPKPLVMKSETESVKTAPMRKVVIVDQSSLLHPLVAEAFYAPIVDGLQDKLSEHAIPSSITVMDQKSLNPNDGLIVELKRTGARHIIYIQPTKINAIDPEKSLAVRTGLRVDFVRDYILTFTIADLAAKKNIWKGTIETPRTHIFHKGEVPEIMSLLEAELVKVGLIQLPQK